MAGKEPVSADSLQLPEQGKYIIKPERVKYFALDDNRVQEDFYGNL
jgi:hypothetical protein